MAPFDRIDGIEGAVGFIMPWAHVEIVDEAGTPLPAGREGVIRYRTLPFLADVAASDAPAEDQWFYPGDVGSLTDTGILCLTGRTSDLINIGGVKLSARHIEEIVEAMEEVREAAACGVQDAASVEQLWVAVVANGTVDSEALKAKVQAHPDVRGHLSELFVVPELPRGDLGKVQKAKLKEMLLGLRKEQA
jgi:acyl-coenzyme A synthetase/AMP-(fatty) acid ligase